MIYSDIAGTYSSVWGWICPKIKSKTSAPKMWDALIDPLFPDLEPSDNFFCNCIPRFGYSILNPHQDSFHLLWSGGQRFFNEFWVSLGFEHIQHVAWHKWGTMQSKAWGGTRKYQSRDDILSDSKSYVCHGRPVLCF